MRGLRVPTRGTIPVSLRVPVVCASLPVAGNRESMAKTASNQIGAFFQAVIPDEELVQWFCALEALPDKEVAVRIVVLAKRIRQWGENA
jgi:hypothetical protein